MIRFILILLVSAFTCKAQVGIGTSKPHSSSTLEIVSEDKGILIPRLALEAIDGIADPAEGLLVYCSNCPSKGFYFYDGNAWLSLMDGLSDLGGNSQSSIISSPTGKEWLAKNLGAEREATSLDDFKSFGDFYQFGRGNDGHQIVEWIDASSPEFLGPNSETFGDAAVVEDLNEVSNVFYRGSSISDFWYAGDDFSIEDFWQGVGGINNPCPYGFRLPTVAEFEVEFATQDFESDTYDINTFYLKVAETGFRNSSGFYSINSIRISFWTSTVVESVPQIASIRKVLKQTIKKDENKSSGKYSTSFSNSFPKSGFPVRCIRD